MIDLGLYSPMWFNNLALPQDRETINKWTRAFYNIPTQRTAIYRIRVKRRDAQQWNFLSRSQTSDVWETSDLNEAYQELARKSVWWDHEYDLVEYTGQQP